MNDTPCARQWIGGDGWWIEHRPFEGFFFYSREDGGKICKIVPDQVFLSEHVIGEGQWMIGKLDAFCFPPEENRYDYADGRFVAFPGNAEGKCGVILVRYRMPIRVAWELIPQEGIEIRSAQMGNAILIELERKLLGGGEECFYLFCDGEGVSFDQDQKTIVFEGGIGQIIFSCEIPTCMESHFRALRKSIFDAYSLLDRLPEHRAFLHHRETALKWHTQVQEKAIRYHKDWNENQIAELCRYSVQAISEIFTFSDRDGLLRDPGELGNTSLEPDCLAVCFLSRIGMKATAERLCEQMAKICMEKGFWPSLPRYRGITRGECAGKFQSSGALSFLEAVLTVWNPENSILKEGAIRAWEVLCADLISNTLPILCEDIDSDEPYRICASAANSARMVLLGKALKEKLPSYENRISAVCRRMEERFEESFLANGALRASARYSGEELSSRERLIVSICPRCKRAIGSVLGKRARCVFCNQPVLPRSFFKNSPCFPKDGEFEQASLEAWKRAADLTSSGIPKEIFHRLRSQNFSDTVLLKRLAKTDGFSLMEEKLLLLLALW